MVGENALLFGLLHRIHGGRTRYLNGYTVNGCMMSATDSRGVGRLCGKTKGGLIVLERVTSDMSGVKDWFCLECQNYVDDEDVENYGDPGEFGLDGQFHVADGGECIPAYEVFNYED